MLAPPLLTVKLATISGPLRMFPPHWSCGQARLSTSSLHALAWGCLGTLHTPPHAPHHWWLLGYGWASVLFPGNVGAGLAGSIIPPLPSSPRPWGTMAPTHTCPVQAQPIRSCCLEEQEEGSGRITHSPSTPSTPQPPTVKSHMWAHGAFAAHPRLRPRLANGSQATRSPSSTALSAEPKWCPPCPHPYL